MAFALGMEEVEKPPVLAASGGCWFRGGWLGELAAALQSAGVDVTWDPELPAHDRFYAADPFGNRLEFLQRRRDD